MIWCYITLAFVFAAAMIIDICIPLAATFVVLACITSFRCYETHSSD